MGSQSTSNQHQSVVMEEASSSNYLEVAGADKLADLGAAAEADVHGVLAETVMGGDAVADVGKVVRDRDMAAADVKMEEVGMATTRETANGKGPEKVVVAKVAAAATAAAAAAAALPVAAAVSTAAAADAFAAVRGETEDVRAGQVNWRGTSVKVAPAAGKAPALDAGLVDQWHRELLFGGSKP